MGGIVRAAVVGGRRGRGYRRAFAALPDAVQLAAICDRDPAVLTEWAEAFPDVPRFAAFEELLAADVCDAVFLATPIQAHVSQALAALSAGKHVLSEVPAATTIEECWALVEAVERSGRTYMLAENYCYMRPNMLVRNMVQGDVFGPCTYAEKSAIDRAGPEGRSARRACRVGSGHAERTMAWRRRRQHRRRNRHDRGQPGVSGPSGRQTPRI